MYNEGKFSHSITYFDALAYGLQAAPMEKKDAVYYAVRLVGNWH